MLFFTEKKMTRIVQILPQKQNKIFKKQDQLQRTNTKQKCKMFMIYL